MVAGAAACPFAFSALWAKRWFKIIWWIGVLMMLGAWLRFHGILK